MVGSSRPACFPSRLCVFSERFGSWPDSVSIFDIRASSYAATENDPQLDPEIFSFLFFFFRMQLSDCCQHVSHMKDRNHDPLQHIKDPSFDFPPRSHGCMVMYDIVEVRKIPRKGHALKLSSLVSHSAWKRNRGRE